MQKDAAGTAKEAFWQSSERRVQKQKTGSDKKFFAESTATAAATVLPTGAAVQLLNFLELHTAARTLWRLSIQKSD